MALRFHLDEHMPSAIASGLRRRGIDVTTTTEVGLRSHGDEDHLAFALRESRVIVTCDEDFLRLASSGAGHAGLIFCPPARTVRQIVEFLCLADECLSSEEMADHIEFC